MITKGYIGSLSDFYSLGWQVYLYNGSFGQLSTVYSFGPGTDRYYRTNISGISSYPVNYDSTLFMVNNVDAIHKVIHVAGVKSGAVRSSNEIGSSKESAPLNLECVMNNEQIYSFYKLISSKLDKRGRRLVFGALAKALGRGGISRISSITGMSGDTLSKGVKELESRGTFGIRRIQK